jgi:hypothetical protein
MGLSKLTCVSLSICSPQSLVRCTKIVEMQEAIDAEAAREQAESKKDTLSTFTM